jgi:hypothetical protein
MKKIVISLLFLVMVVGVSAENIGIDLVEYDAESGSSRISVSNFGDKELNDITIQIDASPEFPVVSLLSSGTTVYSILSVIPGEHSVTIRTKEEISESRTLLFSQSKEGLQQEKEDLKKAKDEEKKRENELKGLAERNRQESELELKQARNEAIALGAIEEDRNLVWWVAGIAIVLIIFIVFWLLRRKE